MLEIDMTIVDNKFATSLYDKRNNFGFPIVKFQSQFSNIHSSTMYNIFTTQVIRVSKVCNNLPQFLLALHDLFNTLHSKGCKKHILLKKLFKIIIKKHLIKKFKMKNDIQHITTFLKPFLVHPLCLTPS